jgi:hypothetical protein
MRKIWIYVGVMVFVAIVVGFLFTAALFFYSLRTEKAIKQEIKRIERGLLPIPDSIDTRIFPKAGMDEYDYIVTIDYKCSSELEARNLERRIKEVLR